MGGEATDAVATGLVFVSYRRDDSKDFTLRLVEHLRKHCPDVFVDNDDIRYGDDWRSKLTEAVGTARALVVVIGRQWATLERDGTVRLHHEDDWVRAEIRTALGRGIPVFVVRMNDTQLPAPEQLPPDIRDLLNSQAVPIRSDLLAHDLPLLVEAMRRRGIIPRPHGPRGLVAAAAALSLSVVGLAVSPFFPEPPPPPKGYALSIPVTALPPAAPGAVITAGSCTSSPPAAGRFTMKVTEACDRQPLSLTRVPGYCDQALGDTTQEQPERQVEFGARPRRGRICVDDHARSPLAQAFVTIDDSPRMATGDDGCIEVPLGCDSGPVHVTVSHDRYPEPMIRELDFSKGATQRVAMRDPPPRRIAIEVVNVAHEPVTSARVRVAACNIDLPVGNDGALQLELPPGCRQPADLEIRAPSYQTATLTEDQVTHPVVMTPDAIPCTPARCATVRAAAQSRWPGEHGACQCPAANARCAGAFGQGNVAAACQCQGSCAF